MARNVKLKDINQAKKMRSGRVGPPPMDPRKSYINPRQEDQMEVEGYRVNRVRQAIVWAGIALTLGLLRLVFHWKPEWMLQCTHSTCSLEVAERVLLKDMYCQMFVAEVIVSTKDGTRVKILEPGDAFQQSRPRKNSRSGLLTRDLGDHGDSHAKQQTEETGLNNSESTGSLLRDEVLMRYFNCKKLKYIWDPCRQEFSKVRGLEDGVSCSYFHQCRGLSIGEQYRQRVLYGTNRIVVHVTPIIVLLFKEGLNPFYIFQVFSCGLWYADEYYYYASTIVFISVISLSTTIYQTRKMQRALRNTISSSTVVTLCRGDEEYEDISSEDLVPGDVVEIPRSGCMLQCDAVLLSGNVIVNESMLTGESVPVTKTPLPNPTRAMAHDLLFSIKEHSRHTLFCGTQVIQTRYYGNQKVKAVVIRTGFCTAKGELVRSILFPKPVDFKFNRDTYYFIGVLALVSMIGFIYTVILMVERGDGASHIVLRALDLITIAVPPALPAAMTVGIVFAQSRLKRSGIYCISPRSINVCGSINVVCFDKTGTLTEDGLDFHSVVPVSNSIFGQGHTTCKKLDSLPLLVSMAACHSLTIIDRVLSGDPLDLIMFEATDWELEEPGIEESTRFDMMAPTVVKPKILPHFIEDTDMGVQVGVIRQFTFSSSLQRMSVITRTLGSPNFDLYAKGAPEIIASLSNPDTVPTNFQEVLMGYTQHGYRVLALAWKPLPPKLNYVKVQRVQREQVEMNLRFLGLLVMENRLKPETSPVVHQLRDADIRTIMVTGDNMLTALSVARECGLVDRTDRMVLVNAGIDTALGEPALEFVYADDREKEVEEVVTYNSDGNGTTIKIDEDNPRLHFAVTGKSWASIKLHFPDILSKIVVRGAVFARMSPDQKGQLVEVLQDLGYYVGMCGDGANDCGALKMAHAGISLSEAEASVASPFTSKHPNIECVPTVIREGRCALVTSFGIFKYMASYSLTQFVSVCMLYWIGSSLTDFEFLYIDLFLITTLGITFGRTGPYKELVKEMPPVSLLSWAPIMSLVVHSCINTAAQTVAYFYVQDQPWFTPYENNDEEEYVSYENSTVYLVSSFQYIILAVIFSKGAPYRKNIFTNYFFVGNIILCTGISVLSLMYPPAFLADLLELRPAPSMIFRAILLGVSVMNFFACIIAESFLLDSSLIRKKCREVTEHCLPSIRYEYAAIEQEIAETPEWPPVSGSSSSKQLDAFSSMAVTDGAPNSHHIMSWSGDEGSLDGCDEVSDRGSTPSHRSSSPSQLLPHQQSGNGDQYHAEMPSPDDLMSMSNNAVPSVTVLPDHCTTGSKDASTVQTRGDNPFRPDCTGTMSQVELRGDVRDDGRGTKTESSTTTHL